MSPFGPSPGRTGAGIFYFVPGAMSHDTEDDRQSFTGLIFSITF